MNAIERAGKKLRAARSAEKEAFEEARTAAIDAIENGTSETAVAIICGVDRMTVRKWLGKR